jgi:hypothetical protein
LRQSDNGDVNLPQQGNSEARVWILLYVFEEFEQLLLALCLVIFQVMGFPAQANVDMEIRIRNLGRNQKHVIS